MRAAARARCPEARRASPRKYLRAQATLVRSRPWSSGSPPSRTSAPASDAGAAHARADRGGRARRRARARRVRARRAPPPRLPRLRARRRARRDRRCARSGSGSPAPSPCSAPRTRCASSSSSPSSTCSPAAAPRSWPGAARSSSPSPSSATTSTTTTSCSPRSSTCCSRCASRRTSPGRAATAPPLENAGVWPRPLQDPLPVWVAVGGTPQSAVRAGALGLPLTIAIIGGQPERFAPFVELYRRAAAAAGHEPPVPSRSTRTRSSARTSEQADNAFARALPRDDEPRSAASAAGRPRAGASTTRCARRAARSPSATPSRSPRRSSSSTSCSAISATSGR